MDQAFSLEPRPYLLMNKIQHYAWGTRGEEAFIPHLLGIEVEPDTPYAELWMGTHPKAPSEVVVEGSRVSLRQLISQYPQEILGPAVAERFSGALPFLFKVLSTAETLSIQAHPNQAQARSLHARDPEHYLTGSHKPELAIALDSLTALLGFRSFPGILQALERYPELAGLIGKEAVDRLKNAGSPSPPEQRELVREAYATLVRRSVSHERELNEAIDRLADRLRQSPDALNEEERLFLDLRRKYAGADVGLLSIFLLNLVHLTEGQGVFIGPGIPHAYLRGNIVECMANSDNVVRAGLTPKFKDVETLVDILTYDTNPIPVIKETLDREEVVYPTPVPEFRVSRWRMEAGRTRREVTRNGIEILLVTRGEILIRWETGEAGFQRGRSILIPALLREFELAAGSPAELFKAEVPLY